MVAFVNTCVAPGTEFESLIDEVKGRLEELAQESGHHMSKKAKKAQRATFREYCDTVANDNPPEHSVVFVGGVLELSTWREIKQLECVRSCLQVRKGGVARCERSIRSLRTIYCAYPTNDRRTAPLSTYACVLVLCACLWPLLTHVHAAAVGLSGTHAQERALAWRV